MSAMGHKLERKAKGRNDRRLWWLVGIGVMLLGGMGWKVGQAWSGAAQAQQASTASIGQGMAAEEEAVKRGY